MVNESPSEILGKAPELLLSDILAKQEPDLTDKEVDLLIEAFRKERREVDAAQAIGKKKPKSTVKEQVNQEEAKKLTTQDILGDIQGAL